MDLALVVDNPQKSEPGDRDEAPVEDEEHDNEADDEADDRYEAQVEDEANNFKDEPPFFHNVYPERDVEENHDGEAVRCDILRGDGKLYKDQKFFSVVAFKEAVLDYALKSGRNVVQYRWDKTKCAFKCVGDGCCWRIYCAITRDSPMWRVRVFKNVHNCVRNGECEMLKVPVIARLFVDKIREEPSYFMPIKIMDIIKERWGISVTRNQCQSARKKAIGWINREYAEQFSRLRDYGAELQLSNEGTTVQIDTVKNDAGEDVFNRFYVCFEVLRNTWKESCRRLIGVDGSFLRSTLKGQLLVALGRDANNAIYPVAWAVVRVEDTENWLWFVKLIKADLGLGDGEGYILVSDRCKGIIKAAATELPNAEHRHCVRHIYGNIKKKHGGKPWIKPFIWNLAWSYNMPEYEMNLKRFEDMDVSVYNDILKTKPENWCRAFYKLGNFCEDVDNNFVESFNSSIVRAREKPFMPMLETIRRMAMARIAERNLKSHTHQGLCTPYVAKIFAAQHAEASLCGVTRSTNGWWESYVHGEPFRVNLDTRSCSCKKWDICGIPCEHAYGVIMKRNLQPEDYVSHWFTTEMWKSNYRNGLKPVRGMRFWPSTNAPLVHVIPVSSDEEDNPKKNKPDKKRKKPKHESPTKKKHGDKRRVMHCGVCGAAHHNSRFHANEMLHRHLSESQASVDKSGLSAKAKATKATQASQPQASQPQASQPQASQPQASQPQASQSSQPPKAKHPSKEPAQSSSQASLSSHTGSRKLVWKKGVLTDVKKEPPSPKKKKAVSTRKAVDNLSFHFLDPRSNLGSS